MNFIEALLYAVHERRRTVATVPAAQLWEDIPSAKARRHLAPGRAPSALGWPVLGIISSPFGHRRRPRPGASTEHQGVDIAAQTGAPVWSPAKGHVACVGWRSGYGLSITVDHGGGTQTVYAHLSQTYVRRGDDVTAHQLIGAVGSSGVTTGPHLHYEVRRGGRAVDPGLG